MLNERLYEGKSKASKINITLNILYLTVDKLNISSAFISYFRDCRAFKDWKITMRTATVTRDW